MLRVLVSPQNGVWRSLWRCKKIAKVAHCESSCLEAQFAQFVQCHTSVNIKAARFIPSQIFSIQKIDAMAQYDDSNIFAKILRKEIPASVIFETEHSLAILDAFPCTPYHSLLLPKVKAKNVAELSSQPHEVLGCILADLARLDAIVKKAAEADATNVVANGGPAAGQIVPHLHFHIIPRKKDDRLITPPKSRQTMLNEDESREILSKMHAA
eukprot:Blabericola_migrator_1__6532@NODE_3295_length_1881_cov_124_390849_g2058_i0_p1_GENE_NODE_3295_length_1881_cov_124_390849_g2058_i0NODE_3295_length_1881_cov_124_390849_g2058_i0_p1_ORF_typecomplete_len212_score40_32HIT/PF01230_23/5_4e24DcpS_C/PF11969_8/8_1e10GalP_UDP_tr_C/PF02744_17/0_018_NODE_3295_length_1881_cov_124_390849_g2058_i060695